MSCPVTDQHAMAAPDTVVRGQERAADFVGSTRVTRGRRDICGRHPRRRLPLAFPFPHRPVGHCRTRRDRLTSTRTSVTQS